MDLGRFRLWGLFLGGNLVGFALLGYAHMLGLVELVLKRDQTPVSPTIFALFLVGLALCAFRVKRLNESFNNLQRGDGVLLTKYRKRAEDDVSAAIVGMETHLFRLLRWIKWIGGVLPALGLFGTVLGLTLSLEGDLLTGGTDLSSAAAEILPKLLSGLGVAFYTTLVGVIFWLWLSANLEMLENESERLIVGVIESANDEVLRRSGKLPAPSNGPSQGGN